MSRGRHHRQSAPPKQWPAWLEVLVAVLFLLASFAGGVSFGYGLGLG
ncbi:hypothetical protein [Mycolicibacterium sp. A43C]